MVKKNYEYRICIFEWMKNNSYIIYYQVETIPTDRIIQMTLGTASHEILFHSCVDFQISKPNFSSWSESF